MTLYQKGLTFLRQFGAPACLLGVFAFMSGCASQNVHRLSGLGDQLADVTEETLYTGTTDCLMPYQFDVVEVLDDQRVLFRSATGNNVWINELRNSCPSLKSYDAVKFERRMSQLCNLDTIQGVNSFFTWWDGPRCTLGKFRKVDEAQAQRILEAVM